MVVRMAFIGCPRVEKKKEAFALCESGGELAFFCQCFTYRSFLIVYVEWEAETEKEARQAVAAWLPGSEWMRPVGLHGQPFVEMELIFSYNRPQNALHWKRKIPGVACGSVARIQTGKLGSYAYYHHILQETVVRKRDKYGAIFVYGDLLFYYREQPGEQEFPWYQGTVQGKIPADWRERMQAHFGEWEDGTVGWKKMKGGGQICATG